MNGAGAAVAGQVRVTYRASNEGSRRFHNPREGLIKSAY